MAEAMLVPVANGIVSLLSLLTKQIDNPIKPAWDFKEGLEKLLKRLKTIHALLLDAENRRITSETMVVWLKDLKAATCDAENVLDELAYEDLRRKIEVQNRMCDKVRNFFSPSNPLVFHFKMAGKVSDINKLLDRIYKEAIDVGLKPAEQVIGPIVEPREFMTTGPSLDETQVVGRDDDVLKVVDMLLGIDIRGDLPVIAIVGMAGVGKTTLAQIVYNKWEVMENFCYKSVESDKIDKRMWICVSDNFKVDRLLNEMVESLGREKSDVQNRQGVLKMLGKELNGKKYLLVLDDVWNTNPDLWVDLRNSLTDIKGSKGSKILITTRNWEVVDAIQTFPICIHELNLPSEDDCWQIFSKRAFANRLFANRTPSEIQTLDVIGRRMVKKCERLPLAINALGSLLFSKRDRQEWEFIEKSETWNSPKKSILPVLRLSFDNLPSLSLKNSFAYCSIFPKGKVIIKDELIQLWMALGYLQSSSRSKVEMEELGNEYFMTLWRNSLFQEVEFDEYKNITTCKMHDLVHDLAFHVSQGNCLTLKASEMKNISDVQHLSLFLPRLSLVEETGLDILELVGKLRTLFLTGHLPETEKDFNHIRALRLVESCVDELPSSICKSIHLRFLDISESSILKIPNCITKLYNLETLKLPRSPEELPKDFHNLVSLRHFYIEDSNENRELMPKNIGQLTSLRTLPFFVVGNESGQSIEELGNLSNLRGGLRIYDLQHVEGKEEAEKAKMLEKPYIQELKYHWGNDFGEFDNNHEDVLEGLKPHRNVKGLEIQNFGGRGLASWMSKDACLLQNLVKIILKDCRFCEQVPALGHLSHLVKITIDGLQNLKCIGPEFYGQYEEINCNCSSSEGAAAREVFPALRELRLFNLPQLREWSNESSLPKMKLFSSLQKLYIYACPELISIPEFKDSNSLQELEIYDCVELTCLPEGVLQPTLLEIDVRRCAKLKTLNRIDESKAVFKGLTSLQQLVIYDCPELITLPEGVLQPTLQRIDVRKCPKLKTLNPIDESKAVFNGLTSLQLLMIEDCPELITLPGGVLQPTLQVIDIQRCPKLKTLNPIDESKAVFNGLTSLQLLVIYDCPELITLPERVLQPALQRISIQGCPKLKTLNPIDESKAVFNGLTSLEHLVIYDCPELITLPEGVLQPTLQKIDVRRCAKLKTLNPIDESKAVFKGLTALQQLVIYDCPELITLPEGVLQPTLQKIDIRECPKLKTLNPIDESKAVFNGSTSLQLLVIYDCPELITLPEGVLQPTLQRIDIQRCPKLKMLNPIDESKAVFKGLTSLQQLVINDCPEWITLPAWVLQPTLIQIDIQRCPKLKMLNPIDKIAAFNNLTSLRLLGISDCPELTLAEAAFKGSTSLEELRISDCTELTCLPEGVLQPTLREIYIFRCPKLKTLNPIDESKVVFNGLTSLQLLVIIDCPELITLPAWVLQPTLIQIDIQLCPKLKMRNPIDKIAAAFNNLTSLRLLGIDDCPELTLPGFKGSTSLEKVAISGCTELMCLPEGVLQPTLLEIDIRECPKLKMLNPIDKSEAAFNGLMRLQQLRIYDCPELITLPAWVLQPTLLGIDIRRCQKLKMLTPIDESKATFNCSMCLQLPAWVLQPTLVDMDIQRCPMLKMLNPIDEIAVAFNSLTSLRRLWIHDCQELTLPEAAFKGSTSLEEFVISGCTKLSCLPEGVLQPTLIDIKLCYCPMLKTPDPDALRTLTSLKRLVIRSCSNWGSFWEEGLFCTTSLQELSIGEFGEECRYFPWPSTSVASPSWSHLTSLELLNLFGWPEVKSLPNQLEHLPALRALAIWNFSGLESLPKWLGKLSSLEYLSIRGCPLLVERCEKGIGEDWHKIAHIPSIEIDEEEIQ